MKRQIASCNLTSYNTSDRHLITQIKLSYVTVAGSKKIYSAVMALF